MTADLETLVVAAYYFADCLPTPRGPGRPPEVTDGELVALAVAQAAMGIPSDRQFLGLVAYRLPGWFPRRRSRNARAGAPSEPGMRSGRQISR